MQNKANFCNGKMNTTFLLTKDYENKSNWKLGENKANTKPIKANTKPIQTQFAERPPDVQIDVNLVKTRKYNNEQRTMNYELLFKLVRHSLGEGGTNPNKANFNTKIAGPVRNPKEKVSNGAGLQPNCCYNGRW